MIVVMPMAGRGSRFTSHGIEIPKPLIQVLGRPMFQWALQSLQGMEISKFVAVFLQEHDDLFQIGKQVKQEVPYAEIVSLPDVLSGQLCSVLAAREYIDSDEDLLVVPSDTLVISQLSKDIKNLGKQAAGIISVAKMPGTHWSFAKIEGKDNVVEVAEKMRISDYASTGLYYFSNGSQFVRVAEEMINNQEKTKGEYYVIPVYNKLLKGGFAVKVSFAEQLWDMGNPRALTKFINEFDRQP